MEAEIQKRIKETREFKGVTQLDLANSLEMSLVSYSKIERGETKLTISHIERIAKALGVDPYYFISGEEFFTDVKAMRNENYSLRKENEILKKDIERYKGIIDTYQDKILLADSVIDLLKRFKDEVGIKDQDKQRNSVEEILKEAREIGKEIKL